MESLAWLSSTDKASGLAPTCNTSLPWQQWFLHGVGPLGVGGKRCEARRKLTEQTDSLNQLIQRTQAL